MVSGIILSGYLYYQHYEHNFRAEIESELSCIAESRVGELTQWRKERLGDGAILFKNITFSRLVRRFLEQPGNVDAQQELKAWMVKYHTAYQYARVALYDTQGIMRMSDPQTPGPYVSSTAKNVTAILGAGQVVIDDFHRNTPDSPIHLAVVIPIFDESDNSRPLGVLALNIDPTTYLYPFLSYWPTPSPTAETLLVRRDGDAALFLSELRFRKNAPLNLRVPLTQTEIPAVRAALGQTGVMDGVDYRGEPQIAVVRAVPDSPWYLIVRMNVSEVYEPMRERLWQMVAFTSVLLFGSAAALGFVWRQRSARYLERDVAEAKLRRSEERFRAILDNTSAVIYLKELEGRFILVNRRFEELFHLQHGEIVGKTDHDLFPKAMADAFRANDLRVINSGASIDMEEVAPQDDGLRTYISTKFPIKDEHGYIYAVAGISTDITLLRQEEKELRRVKESLSKAQEIAKIGNWEWDIVTNDSWWSDEAYRLFDMEPSTVPTYDEFIRMVCPENREMVNEAIKAALRGEKPYEFDFSPVLPDGAKRVLRTIGQVIRDETGNPLKILGTTQDVTDRRKAEAELRASRERMSRIVETVAEGIYIVNAEGKIEFVNAAAEKIFGLPRSELYQRAFNDPSWIVVGVDGIPFGPDDYPFARVKKSLQPVRNIEFTVSRAGGSRIVVSINAAPLFDQDGAFAGMVATQRDITEEKRAEVALKESERKYRALIEGASEAIIMVDDRGNIREANRKAEALFGRRKEQLIGMSYQALMSPESLTEATATFTDLLARGGSIHLQDVTILAPERGQVPVEITGSLIDYSEGRFLQGIFRDTTARKKAEDALKKAHSENEQLIASLPSILIWVDDEDKVVRWNTGAEVAFGIKASDALHVQFTDLKIQWDWSKALEYVTICHDKGEILRANDVPYVRASGKDGFLGVTFAPVLESDGEWRGFLLLAADVTERKMLESQLVQAQKLESIGQLAAGIAHEINTPIQFVGDNLRFLKDSFADLIRLLSECSRLTDAVKSAGAHEDMTGGISELEKEIDVEYLCEEIPKAVTQSLGGVERVAKIVRAMKEFSHPGVEEKTPIDINKAIESTIMVCKNEWKYVSDMVTDFDPDMPFVPCVPGEFNQVILNLIVNAAHAIADMVGDGSKGKGKITMTTRRAEEFAEIRIADTGGGIPDKIREKIFDPFFTTKPVGKGTGQGLAIARNVIVDKHKGSITVETEPGKGTTFIIRIPINSDGGM